MFRKHIQVHSLDVQSFPFESILALNTFHLFLRLLSSFPTFLFFFALWDISLFISFHPSFPISTSSIFFNNFCTTVSGWDRPQLLFLFISLVEDEGSRARFPVRNRNVLGILRLLRESSNDDAKELVAVMQYTASRCKQLVVVPIFSYSDDAVLREVGAQHTR